VNSAIDVATGGEGRAVPAGDDLHRLDEVLVEVVDELDHASILAAGDGDEVEHREVLHGFAEADAAGVRAHGYAELRRQQEDRDVLVDPGHAGRVDLEDLEGVRLQELLEHDAVGHVLAGRDRDRGDAARDGRVAEDVVGTRRLLDPGDVVRSESRHPVDRLGDVPALVRVDRDADVRTHRVPGDGEATDVVLHSTADLELHLREAVRDGLPTEAVELLVGVPEPAGRRRVGGVAGGEEGFGTSRATRLRVPKDLERVVAGEHVAQVAEVDEFDELLRRHGGQQLPERQTCAFRFEVPEGVHDGTDRHVHDPLLRAEPTQLGVVDELTPEGTHGVEDRLDLAPEEVLAEGVDGGDLDVVAAADREDEAVTLVPVVRVGDETQVRGRIVGVGVHGV
jgi:hypothetical protein